MAENYVYTPLENIHDIRLFSYTSSKPKRRFFSRSRCSRIPSIDGILRRVCLDDSHQQPYIALSYTWGCPFPPGLLYNARASITAQQTIKCDGIDLRVGENLHDALLAFRTLKPSLPIWIDALCINQNDLTERNAQVSMMGDVYAKAAAVYVWLGPHDDPSRKALPAMERLHHAFTSMPPYQRPRGRYQFNDPTLYKIIHSPPITDEEWQAIVNFFSRTWFHRIWIAQEAALSVDLIFICGDSRISSNLLISFARAMCELHWDGALDRLRLDKMLHPTNGTAALFQIAKLISCMRDGLNAPYTEVDLAHLFGAPREEQKELFCAFFASMLVKSRARLASDPRDKVFAPLALAKQITKDRGLADSLPSPDYLKSAETIYYETAAFIISQLGNLSFLSFVERHGTEPPNFPTWAPYLSFNTSSKPLSKMNHDATRSWNSEIRPVVENRFLNIKGILFDIVSDITVAHRNTHADPTPLIDLISHHPQRNTVCQPRVEELFRTLVQDDFTSHWEEIPHGQTRHQPLHFPTVVEHFKQWITSRIALHALNILKPSDSFHIPPKVLATCGTSPLFPTAAELSSFVPHFIKNMQPGPNRDAYRSDTFASWQLFENMIAGYADERCILRTCNRSIFGLGPLIAKAGDEVWFLHGARVPFLLRKLPNGHRQLVGEAYLQGYMQGEVLGRGGASVRTVVDVVLQ